MKKGYLFGLIGALMYLITGCSDSAKGQGGGAAMPPVPVKVYIAEAKDIALQKTYPASIKSTQEASVIARVKGILEKSHFVEGSSVKKGDMLFTIEQDSYRANLESAKATLEKSEANLLKAQKDWERVQKLIETKSISDQEADSYLSAYKSAKAEVSGAKAALKQAEIEFGYTTIKAPISGKAGVRLVDVGNYVGQNEQNSLLLTITSVDPIYADFYMPKSDIDTYMPLMSDQNISITLYGANGALQGGGKIEYIAPRIDQNTNTLMMRASFPNSDESVKVGDFLKLEIGQMVLKNSMVIPEEAIVQTPKGSMVFVVEEGVAKLRPVTTSIATDKGIGVLSGLTGQEAVVVSNIAKLRPEAKVQIVNGK